MSKLNRDDVLFMCLGKPTSAASLEESDETSETFRDRALRDDPRDLEEEIDGSIGSCFEPTEVSRGIGDARVDTFSLRGRDNGAGMSANDMWAVGHD